MKKHLLYLCTIGISLFLTSCITGIERDISISSNEDAEISVEQAREFFEQELLTRNDDTPSPNILSPGDFTPQWDNAKVSQNNRIACVDVPIIPRFGYRAIRSEYKLGKATAYTVRVSQKLIVVKGRESGNTTQYLMSIIPDKEFAAKHKGDISNLFLNANDRGRFSGIVLYTHHGIPVTVNKYIDGVYTGGATICGVKDDIQRTQRFKQIIKSISGIRFKKCTGISSRAGEDGNWEEEEDDNWWDFDDEYIYIGGGLYVDEEGNLYIDYDNDGEIDSIYIPPVDITPEDPGDGGGDEPPTGEKDPPGDNGEGEYGEDIPAGGGGSADIVEQTAMMNQYVSNLINTLNNKISNIKDHCAFSIGDVFEGTKSIIILHKQDIYDKTTNIECNVKLGLSERHMRIVIAHECLHLALLEISRNAGSPSILSNENKELYELIKDFNINQGHHEYMATHIDEFKQLLRDAFPGESNEYYEYGVWSGGLIYTNAFYNLSSDTKCNILNYLQNNGI